MELRTKCLLKKARIRKKTNVRTLTHHIVCIETGLKMRVCCAEVRLKPLQKKEERNITIKQTFSKAREIIQQFSVNDDDGSCQESGGCKCNVRTVREMRNDTVEGVSLMR